MASKQHFSKSTKRRRFIEEVDVVELFRESPIQSSELIPIASTSSHINTSNKNEYSQLIIPQPSTISDTDILNNSNEFEPNVDSPSDSDVDTTDEVLDEQYSGFNFYDNDSESILKGLAQWAVSHNITNVALSA